jgi:hypothetical protein
VRKEKAMRHTSLILFAIIVASPVHANLVVNGSFESPTPDASWVDDPAAGGNRPVPAKIPTGWQGTGEVNLFRPSTVAYPSGVGPDGLQIGATGDIFGPGALFQDLPVTLIAGSTYSVSGFIGNRADSGGSGEILLETTLGAIVASTGAVTSPSGTFQKVGFSYTALPGNPNLGEGLRIVLDRPTGLQANFDDIQITVPEPSSLLIASLGLAGLIVAVRARKHAKRGARAEK